MRRRSESARAALRSGRLIRPRVRVCVLTAVIGIGAALAPGPLVAGAGEPQRACSEARVIADAEEARAEMGRLWEWRVGAAGRSVGDRADRLERLRATAAVLEGTAHRSSNPMLRRALLTEAAWGYFAASVPLERDPPNDPLRRRPAGAWEDCLRLAWESAGGATRGEDCDLTALPLLPVVAFDGEVHRIGPVYGDAYWRPALELMQVSQDPLVRVRAGAFAAERCMLADWDLACALLGELQAIESSLGEEDPGRDTSPLHRTVADLTAVLADELWRCGRDLQRALDIYLAARSNGSAPDLPPDGAELWGLLRPHLPEAIRQGPWSERYPEWMDLGTNRFLTHPGLRLERVRLSAGAAGRPRATLILRIRMTDG